MHNFTDRTFTSIRPFQAASTAHETGLSIVPGVLKARKDRNRFSSTIFELWGLPMELDVRAVTAAFEEMKAEDRPDDELGLFAIEQIIDIAKQMPESFAKPRKRR